MKRGCSTRVPGRILSVLALVTLACALACADEATGPRYVLLSLDGSTNKALLLCFDGYSHVGVTPVGFPTPAFSVTLQPTLRSVLDDGPVWVGSVMLTSYVDRLATPMRTSKSLTVQSFQEVKRRPPYGTNSIIQIAVEWCVAGSTDLWTYMVAPNCTTSTHAANAPVIPISASPGLSFVAHRGSTDRRVPSSLYLLLPMPRVQQNGRQCNATLTIRNRKGIEVARGALFYHTGFSPDTRLFESIQVPKPGRYSVELACDTGPVAGVLRTTNEVLVIKELYLSYLAKECWRRFKR